MKYIKFIIALLVLFGCVSVYAEEPFDREGYLKELEPIFFPQPRSIGSSSRCCSSVLFIPGFKGTRLFDGDRQLWEANSNSDVRDLFLNEGGNSINSNVSVGEMIKRTNVGFGVFDTDVYQGISDMFDSLVSSGVIREWDTVEYDWRKDLLISGKIFGKIQHLAQHSYDGQVILVGHSNGGLMVKKILSVINPDFGELALKSSVLVATPQLGSAQTIGSLLHGDGESVALGLYVNKETAREWGRNMLGAYNLLPVGDFLKNRLVPLVSFASSTNLVSGFREAYGESLMSTDSLNAFLLGTNDGRVISENTFSNLSQPLLLNPDLFQRALEFHSVIGNVVTNIPIYQIAGINFPTTSGIEYFTKESCALTAGPTCIPIQTLDHKTLKTVVGDGVVEVASAIVDKEHLLGSSFLFDISGYNRSRNSNKIHHATIFEAEPIHNLIKNILGISSSTSPYIVQKHGSFVGDTNHPILTFAVHSPVTLHITDSQGRVTERSKLEIPNSVYEEVGEGKYITMLEPQNGQQNEIHILIQGTGDGIFSFDITKTVGEIVTTEAIFSHIPVSSSTRATLEYSSGDSNQTNTFNMQIDFDGDGVVDEERINENENPDNKKQPKEIASERNSPLPLKNIKNRLQRIGKMVLKTVQNSFDSAKELITQEEQDYNTEDGDEQDVGQVGSHSDESVCYPC